MNSITTQQSPSHNVAAIKARLTLLLFIFLNRCMCSLHPRKRTAWWLTVKVQGKPSSCCCSGTRSSSLCSPVASTLCPSSRAMRSSPGTASQMFLSGEGVRSLVDVSQSCRQYCIFSVAFNSPYV